MPNGVEFEGRLAHVGTFPIGIDPSSFIDNLQTVQLRSSQLSSVPEKDGFTFDRVFPPGTKQHEVFDYGVKE